MHVAISPHSPSFTLWLFFSLQTCLRHPDCESARINKNTVFQRMRLALEQVIEIVTDARSSGEAKALPISIYVGIKDLKVQLWVKSLYTYRLWLIQVKMRFFFSFVFTILIVTSTVCIPFRNK